MTKPHDITGQRFGRLLVQSLEKRDRRHSYWRCVCDCGNEHVTTMNALRRGLVSSCGCFRREHSRTKATTHGCSRGGSSEYGIWAAMKRRCLNPNVRAWKDYGGRGITVCDRWRNDFAAFLEDMGPRPPGRTLERVDNDKNYSPDNCVWEDRSGQARNTRGNRIVTFRGRQMTVIEACESSGLPPSTVYPRINRGWPEADWFLPKMR